MINNTLFKPILLVLYFCINNSYDFPQLKKENKGIKLHSNFSIEWVGQVPSNEYLEKKNKLTNKIINAVFGEKDIGLVKPVAICQYSEDSLFVIDQTHQTVLNYSHKSQTIDILIKKNIKTFPSLVGLCSPNSKNLLFTDSKLNQVFIYDFASDDIHKLNDKLTFQQPTGIAYSKTNEEIWVVETKLHKISVLDKQGNFIKDIGGRGTDPGKFNYPTYIWIDDLGFVYIIDSLNFRVQIFNKDGEFISMFGEQGNASGYFARPKGIATDTFGHIYIVDALFHTVQIFNKKGNFLYQFGNQGKGEGEFWLPSGIFIDKDNMIYVADTYNSRIQIFQLVDNE